MNRNFLSDIGMALRCTRRGVACFCMPLIVLCLPLATAGCLGAPPAAEYSSPRKPVTDSSVVTLTAKELTAGNVMRLLKMTCVRFDMFLPEGSSLFRISLVDAGRQEGGEFSEKVIASTSKQRFVGDGDTPLVLLLTLEAPSSDSRGSIEVDSFPSLRCAMPEWCRTSGEWRTFGAGGCTIGGSPVLLGMPRRGRPSWPWNPRGQEDFRYVILRVESLGEGSDRGHLLEAGSRDKESPSSPPR